MTHCFIIIQTCDRMQSFTILQDKLHPFNKHIQDDQSTPFLCTTNYRIGHNIKREDNSIPGLFSQVICSYVVCKLEWMSHADYVVSFAY